MPVAIVTPARLAQIMADVRAYGQKEGWPEARIAAALDEVETWPWQDVPPGALPQVGAMPLKCGLVFPLLTNDFFIDNNRKGSVIRPAAVGLIGGR